MKDIGGLARWLASKLLCTVSDDQPWTKPWILSLEEIDPKAQKLGLVVLRPVRTPRLLKNSLGNVGWCKRCLSIDWESMLATVSRSHAYKKVFPVEPVVVDPDCPFCRVLEGLGKAQAKRYATTRLLSLAADETGGMEEANCPFIVAVPMGMVLDNKDPAFRLISTYLQQDDDSRAKKVNIRKLDISLLSSWLGDCERSHRCHIQTGNLSGLQLVQCSSRTVVPSTGEERYAALSYVWGSSTAIKLDDQNRLPDVLGQTMEDSIWVVQALGLNYLWIDQCCIPAHDKQRQIGLMHQIYGNAVLTIIAANGKDPHYGLPGVSTRKHIAEIASLHIGSRWEAFHYHEEIIGFNTTWASRGWTYQEAVLSPRTLVFTDEMCAWDCSERCECDAFQNRRVRSFPGLTPGEAWSHIAQYSRRQLSRPEDRVSAIQGILNKIQEAHIESFRHIQGLPLVRRPDVRDRWSLALFRALCWVVEMWFSSETRRERPELFPSWSWAGWDNVRVGYFSSVTDSSVTKVGEHVLLPDIASSELQLHARIELNLGPLEWIDAEDFFDKSTGSSPYESASSAAVSLLRIKTRVLSVLIRPFGDNEEVWKSKWKPEWKGVQVASDGREEIFFEFHSTVKVMAPELPYKVLFHHWGGNFDTAPQYPLLLLVCWMADRQCWERLGTPSWSHPDLLSLPCEVETIILG